MEPIDFSLIAEAITEYLGERCDDFNPDCRTCMAWKTYDRIVTLEAKLAEVRSVAGILERNIKENGQDTHRMKVNGEWHEGPAVDACRDILVSIRQAILSALEAQQEPVAWVAADTLNSPHPRCVSSLAYVSQIDKDRGREYVPLYTHPTLSPAPEAQQEPVAWRWRTIDAETWVYDPSTEWLQENGRNPNVVVEPLFTRPAEPAVTDAMELARAVLARVMTAGYPNAPGPDPKDVEKAFWALDDALRAAKI